jgi:hypothetical protein
VSPAISANAGIPSIALIRRFRAAASGAPGVILGGRRMLDRQPFKGCRSFLAGAGAIQMMKNVLPRQYDGVRGHPVLIPII